MLENFVIIKIIKDFIKENVSVKFIIPLKIEINNLLGVFLKTDIFYETSFPVRIFEDNPSYPILIINNHFHPTTYEIKVEPKDIVNGPSLIDGLNIIEDKFTVGMRSQHIYSLHLTPKAAITALRDSTQIDFEIKSEEPKFFFAGSVRMYSP